MRKLAIRGRIVIFLILCGALRLPSAPSPPSASSSEDAVINLIQEDRPYVAVPQDLFDQLGWSLPDGGSSVKALADAAPGGAFDPRKLENIPADKLGYRAKWQVVRYKTYGLDWDITGLQLTPNQPLPDLPTLVIIHGGSANWYEFFVDLFSNPGLGQYLAQKVRVLLVTLPGNFKYGGWTEPVYDKRIPAYVLDREISPKEAKVRNAVFTFRVVTDGLRQLIEKTTTGPVVIIGHSTGGELPYLMEGTSLKSRLDGLFLGWGSGGPAALQAQPGQTPRSTGRFDDYPHASVLRARAPDGGKENYVQSGYIGPLNPCPGDTPAEVARCWFKQEERRRPQFKQVLQDMEHQGAVEYRDRETKEIRETLSANPEFEVKPEEVIADLYSTIHSPVTGYRKMLWLVGKFDQGHWNKTDPEKAGDFGVANKFRALNPQATIRVAYFDVPITHYGHVERPKQLAGGILAGLRWLAQP